MRKVFSYLGVFILTIAATAAFWVVVVFVWAVCDSCH